MNRDYKHTFPNRPGKKRTGTGKYSLYAFWACTALLLYASFGYYPHWNREDNEATLGWDVSGYYWYLPAAFIYGDLKEQRFKDAILDEYKPTPELQQSFLHPSGAYVNKYSSGMAVMYAPAFFAAHLLAGPLGFKADGFSRPYQFSIQAWSLLVVLAGLWALRRLLRYYFTDGVVAVVLALLVFGSNYLNWAAVDSPESHNYLFTLYTLLLLSTRRFYQAPSRRRGAAIGALLGLMVLTRPPEILAVLIPLLWGLERVSAASLRERWKLWRTHSGAIGLALLCSTAVVAIQPLYWQWATGNWIVYSYQDQGFSWLTPHFYDYTLNLTTGWLVYAPVMWLAIAGFFPLALRGPNRWMALLFCLLNYYVVASWDIWQYGSRAMIQSYPVFMFPMAALVRETFRRKWLLAILLPAALVCINFNLWFTYNAHGAGGFYDAGGMSRHYFLRVAGRWSLPKEVNKLRDTDELFEGTPEELRLLSDTVLLEKVEYLNDTRRSTDTQSVALPHGAIGWIRATAIFTAPVSEWQHTHMANLNVRFSQRGKPVKERFIRAHRLLEDDETAPVYLDVRVPSEPADSVSAWVSYTEGTQLLYVRTLRIYAFR